MMGNVFRNILNNLYNSAASPASALVPGVHLPLHLGQGEGRGGAALAEAGHKVLVL